MLQGTGKGPARTAFLFNGRPPAPEQADCVFDQVTVVWGVDVVCGALLEIGPRIQRRRDDLALVEALVGNAKT